MATAKKTVKVNKVQTLSARAMSEAERAAGIGIATLEDPNALGKADLLAALAWVLAKRDDAETRTFDEYADQHTMAELVDYLGLGE